MSLQNSAPNGKLTKAMVTSAILNEEMRRKSSSEVSRGIEDSVALTEGRGRERNTGASTSGRSRSKARPDKSKPCHYCGKANHWKKDCWKLKADIAKGKVNEDGEENTTAYVSDGDLMMVSECGGACLSQDSTWFYDTGAAFHVTLNRSLFLSYKADEFRSVKMGNSSECKIIGMGNIRLKSKLGSLLLKNVRHVPELRMNLMSGGVLDDEGFASSNAKGKWKLTKGSRTVMVGEKCCSLYKAQAMVCTKKFDAKVSPKGKSVLKASKGTQVDSVTRIASDKISPNGAINVVECLNGSCGVPKACGSIVEEEATCTYVNHGGEFEVEKRMEPIAQAHLKQPATSTRECLIPLVKKVCSQLEDVNCESQVTCVYASGHVVRPLAKRGEAPHATQGTKRSTVQKKATTHDPTILMHQELGLDGRAKKRVNGGLAKKVSFVLNDVPRCTKAGGGLVASSS